MKTAQSMAKLFHEKDRSSAFSAYTRMVKKYVEPHKNDKKPVIALYNSSHGVYRSGIVWDMIETVHGIDGAGNLVISENGKDPNMLSDVWWYRDHKTTVDMTKSMGTKADLIRINPDGEIILKPEDMSYNDVMPESYSNVIDYVQSIVNVHDAEIKLHGCSDISEEKVQLCRDILKLATGAVTEK